MKYGMATLSIIPVRKQANEQSEMVNQILFGETYKIIEENEKWVKIELLYDNYVGWIDAKMLHRVTEFYIKELSKANIFVSTEPSNKIVCVKNSPQYIVAGSSLPFFCKDEKDFVIEQEKCVFTGAFSIVKLNEIHDSIIFRAKKYINTPYLWGGRTPFGIDCSGFTQIIYKMHGIKIYRDVSQQITQGTKRNSREESQTADLAFFSDSKGQANHVGIMISPNEIIHASGMVRIDKIDDTGIFNSQTNDYSHKLTEIRGYIELNN